MRQEVGLLDVVVTFRNRLGGGVKMALSNFRKAPAIKFYKEAGNQIYIFLIIIIISIILKHDNFTINFIIILTC